MNKRTNRLRFARSRNVNDSFRFSLIAGLVLLGATAAPDPDECVRRGNAAFARGEFERALHLYGEAEERTLDPGLVAFNKGAALYRLGRYRAAEDHYRRCREDATGERLARLLYDLGNCLAMEWANRDAARLAQAIASYEECLRQADLDAALADDARHNLEIAKMLLLEARTTSDRDPQARDHGPQKPESENGQSNAPRQGSDADAADPDARHGTVPRTERGPNAAQPLTTDQTPPPGKGNLPPIPDEDELVTLSPEETAAHLRREAERIAREQREYRQRQGAAPARGVMDW